MWEFKTEQKRYDIAGVKVGGIPGEYPTVLIGSLFYEKQKLVEDPRKGLFNHAEAERLIKLQEEFSDKTGNPCMLDVVGSTTEALIKFLDFTAGITDMPLLMDGISSVIRVEALDYAKEAGLLERIIYNSITPEYRHEELDKIKEVRLKSSILLAYTPKDFTSKGRVDGIKDLLPKVSEAGIDKPLIDMCVIDIPSLGAACKAIYELKDQLGLPVGCGAHNAVGTWRGLKTKMGKQAKEPSMAAANVAAAAIGSDLILYGPIETADYMFPAIAMVDVAYGQLIMEQGKRLDLKHPIFRIA